MSLAGLIVIFLSSQSVIASSQPQQHVLGGSSEESWHQYVRSPPSQIVHPLRVLSKHTTGSVTNPNGLVSGKGGTVLSRKKGDKTPMIVVDFGQNIAGFLSINFGGASRSKQGLPGIRLAFSETLEYLTDVSDFTRSYNGDRITPGTDQIAVRHQPYTWNDIHGCAFEGNKVCSDGLHGFRYMKVYLDALSDDAPYTSSYGSVTINSMSLNFTGYLGTPDTFTGWFESSDSQLNQWWYDGVYTNDMCIDTFRKNDTEPRNAASPSLIGKLVLHDGAKRDRDPYVGDLAVASRTAYLSHNVPEATRNVLADLGDHQRDDGWIPPASINAYSLPLLDYPLHWVTCSYDLFIHTNDIAYITKYYPHIALVLDKYYPSITSPTTHLITKGLSNSGGYGDYAFLPRQGPVTYYNALYIIALHNAASIASHLSHHSDATRWSARAALVSDALNEHNFDHEAGAFFDGTCGDHYCPTHAQDGNSLAIVSGAANRSRALSLLSHFSKHHARPWGNSFYDNDHLSSGYSQRVYAFISYFELEARFLSASPNTALEEIRRLYGWMSAHEPGITQWEGIGDGGAKYEGGYTSLAHGWATGVVPVLTNYVLGVKPTGPGFVTWSIRPMPGDVRWARGVVPTPKGEIKVSWEKGERGGFKLVVSAPKGTRGVVAVPLALAPAPAENAEETVFVDGAGAWDGFKALGFEAQRDEDGYVSIVIEDGGNHTITVGLGN